MTTGKKHIIYFLGIGGIGMSALARWFHGQGWEVHGFDAHATPLTRQLEAEGMHIHYEENPNLIPPETEKVVYTPAVPESNAEFRYFKSAGKKMMKRAAVIGDISRDLFTVAVAGTHGKTSVTAMITQILHEAGRPLVAFIGGIAKNFDSNFVLSENPEWMVVEADEFDRSFLQLHPDLAVVTSVDADHLDIYSGMEDLRNTFLEFVRLLPEKGKLIQEEKLNLFKNLSVSRMSYGFSETADLRATDIHIEGGRFCFDVVRHGARLMTLKMLVPGEHYVKNALAAVGVALSLGIENSLIKSALERFKGVQRRFEYRIRTPQRVYIDDYAHHPEELRVTLQAIRKLYPDKKLTVVFQPHLYSRTRDFADDFARVLSAADRLVLLNIYPAREKPIPGVTAKRIADKVTTENEVTDKNGLFAFLKSEKPELLLTAGAGDIGLMTDEIEKILRAL
jgi:UDP-N-acetylmuramate--alanine ligase